MQSPRCVWRLCARSVHAVVARIDIDIQVKAHCDQTALACTVRSCTSWAGVSGPGFCSSGVTAL